MQEIERVLAEVRLDPEFAAAVRGLDLQVLFEFGAAKLRLRLSEANAPADREADDIVISAPRSVWERITASVPPPGYQSFTAVQRLDADFKVVGDGIVVARALHAIERLFELMRKDTTSFDTSPEMDPAAVSGRYRDLAASGRRCRLYYETAGTGIPIVFLHTAGADSRQFHHLLCDTDIGREWAMHAFDMPMHGRSFPPDDWEAGSYRLNASEYADWCVAFIEGVVGKPAVVIGCSMGAAIAIRLAAKHSDKLLGVVALEAPDRSPGRRNPLLCHPEVNQPSYAASYVRGLMSPASPLRHRRLACWYYTQGGLGIYSGDLAFYSEEYDGIELAREIDATRLPMFFLTGEYDYSASPASTERLVAHIPGTEFAVMKGLGHFPMTENPELFKRYLRPVLAGLKHRISTLNVTGEDA